MITAMLTLAHVAVNIGLRDAQNVYVPTKVGTLLKKIKQRSQTNLIPLDHGLDL